MNVKNFYKKWWPSKSLSSYNNNNNPPHGNWSQRSIISCTQNFQDGQSNKKKNHVLPVYVTTKVLTRKIHFVSLHIPNSCNSRYRRQYASHKNGPVESRYQNLLHQFKQQPRYTNHGHRSCTNCDVWYELHNNEVFEDPYSDKSVFFDTGLTVRTP